MNILFISLGCDKNLVDSEQMLGLLTQKGFTLTDDETQADVIVINTCCFIHDAKEESIQNILEMAKFLSDNGTDMWIRHVLVPGLTDDPEGLKRTREFIDSLKTVKRVEVLPYHTLGKFKWEKLGIAYPLEGVRTPTEEEVKTAEELLGIVK